MKTRGQICIIITLLLTLNPSNISIPKVASVMPRPDQFIGEIFPNCTFTMQLIQTNTIITINTLNFSKEIDI